MQECLKRLEGHFDRPNSTQGNTLNRWRLYLPRATALSIRAKLFLDTMSPLAAFETSGENVLSFPKSEWYLVMEASLPNLASWVGKIFNVPLPAANIDAEPQNWKLLPTNDNVMDWKYCESAYRLFSARIDDSSQTSLYVSNSLPMPHLYKEA